MYDVLNDFFERVLNELSQCMIIILYLTFKKRDVERIVIMTIDAFFLDFSTVNIFFQYYILLVFARVRYNVHFYFC